MDFAVTQYSSPSVVTYDDPAVECRKSCVAQSFLVSVVWTVWDAAPSRQYSFCTWIWTGGTTCNLCTVYRRIQRPSGTPCDYGGKYFCSVTWAQWRFCSALLRSRLMVHPSFICYWLYIIEHEAKEQDGSTIEVPRREPEAQDTPNQQCESAWLGGTGRIRIVIRGRPPRTNRIGWRGTSQASRTIKGLEAQTKVQGGIRCW